jgi:hypothetical protein
MTNEQSQIQQNRTALEQAIKRHFEHNQMPDFGNYLLEEILNRLDYERQLKILKPKLWTAVGIFLAGVGLLVLAVDVSRIAFGQTPILHYLSLMFTDFNLIVANWQDYALGVLESLPLGPLAILLSSLLGSIVLVDFAANRLLNFRKALISTHYTHHRKLA